MFIEKNTPKKGKPHRGGMKIFLVSELSKMFSDTREEGNLELQFPLKKGG